ncbi:MAG: hypothetical protein WAZ77_24295, partial [Candidatus Nitrosopolaris sp.]
IINNNKTPAVLVAIAALAAVLVGASAMGSGHMALAGNVNNTGINVPTDTQQKQECETAGGTSPVTGSCTATSTDTVTQSGGIMKEKK